MCNCATATSNARFSASAPGTSNSLLAHAAAAVLTSGSDPEMKAAS
jgi:hypothetical protein